MSVFFLTNQSLNNSWAGRPNTHDSLDGHLNAESEWQTVLDHLVTYVGWTKEFQDGDRAAVYRPPEGPRPYIRFEWNIDGNSRMIDIRAFSDMIDIDTGDDRTPASGDFGLRNRRASESNAFGWFLVADAWGVVGGQRNDPSGNYATAYSTWGAGGFDAIAGGEQYNVWVGGSNSTSTASSRTLGLHGRADSRTIQTVRDHANMGTPQTAYPFFESVLSNTGNSASLSGVSNGLDYPNPSDNELVLLPSHFATREDGTNNNNRRVLRGKLPFILLHPHSSDLDLGLTQNGEPTMIAGSGDLDGHDIFAAHTDNSLSTAPQYFQTFFLDLGKRP